MLLAVLASMSYGLHSSKRSHGAVQVVSVGGAARVFALQAQDSTRDCSSRLTGLH